MDIINQFYEHMLGIISYKDLENYDYIRPSTNKSSWFLILLGNPNNKTLALQVILDNYKYLNRRTKDVPFFMPGYIVGKNGIKAPIDRGSDFDFYVDGFLDTVEWLESNTARKYEYSECMEMILLPFKKSELGLCYDFNNMLSYNLDVLYNEGKNIIKFITNGVQVIKDNMTPEETKLQMEGEKRRLFGEILHTVFIAGSKALERERDAIRSIFSQLSNKGNIWFKTITFEDFERSFIQGGRQNDYNTCIKEEANSVVFVLDDMIGGVTQTEFKIAIDNFRQYGHPQIFVYCRMVELGSIDPDLTEIKKIIDENNQYYTNYMDISDLKNQIFRDFVRIR